MNIPNLAKHPAAIDALFSAISSLPAIFSPDALDWSKETFEQKVISGMAFLALPYSASISLITLRHGTIPDAYYKAIQRQLETLEDIILTDPTPSTVLIERSSHDHASDPHPQRPTSHHPVR